MTKKQIKFLSASGIIVLAVGYLIMSGISKTGQYYLTVNELLEKKDTIYDEGIRMQGKVVGGTINKDTNGLKLNFSLSDEEKPSVTVNVNYEGIVPDLFEADREVVVEGKYSKDGIFYATTLLTSCPSKYEASKNSPYKSVSPPPNTNGEKL